MTETHIVLLLLTGGKGYFAAGEARASMFAKRREARESAFAKVPEH